MRGKRAEFHIVISIIIVLVASIIILGATKLSAEVIRNPDKISQAGFKCRQTLLAYARIKEGTLGTVGIQPQCQVTPMEVPLRPSYAGKEVRRMNAEEFRQVVVQDFSDLVARAWWAAGEGEGPEPNNIVWRALAGTKHAVVSENKCLVMFAVKIKSPKDYPEFKPIRLEDLTFFMSNRTKAAALEKKTDDSIISINDYLSTSGKGAGVFLMEKKDVETGFREGQIVLKTDGADSIYAIGVGFNDIASLKTFSIQTFGKWIGETSSTGINKESKYIIIAPVKEISDYCNIQNE